MQLQLCQHRSRLQLKDMVLSTPASRIPKWRSTLRNAYLITFNGKSIHNMDDLIQAISQARHTGMINPTCQFATDKSYGIHPHHGVTQFYFDQLNVIAKHLQDMKMEHSDIPTDARIHNMESTDEQNSMTTAPLVAEKFTLKQLLKADDWPE